MEPYELHPDVLEAQAAFTAAREAHERAEHNWHKHGGPHIAPEINAPLLAAVAETGETAARLRFALERALRAAVDLGHAVQVDALAYEKPVVLPLRKRIFTKSFWARHVPRGGHGGRRVDPFELIAVCLIIQMAVAILKAWGH